MQPKRTSPRVPDAIDKHVSKRVRMQRLTKGLTQSKLAERIGVSLSTIEAIERGERKWTVYRLVLVARALDCEVGHFFLNAPVGYAMPEEPDRGSLEHLDTRRLLASWDRLTGYARKHILNLTVGMARGQEAMRENERLKATLARLEPELPPA